MVVSVQLWTDVPRRQVMMRFAGGLVILLVCLQGAEAREVKHLDFDWRFIQSDVAGAQAMEFDDSSWRKVDLPHDWSIEGEYKQDNPSGGAGAYLPYGIGWYRRE